MSKRIYCAVVTTDEGHEVQEVYDSREAARLGLHGSRWSVLEVDDEYLAAAAEQHGCVIDPEEISACDVLPAVDL